MWWEFATYVCRALALVGGILGALLATVGMWVDIFSDQS